jgi:catechol 2,3-dioxygenase
MSKVIRLGYVHLRVTDLEESRNHYSNTLGMEVVASEPGKLYLKCWDEWDHHSLVLEEGGVGLVKLGYKVESPEAMTEFESRAQQVRGDHRPVLRGGEPDRRGGGADHAALGAQHRAVHGDGVRGHRDRGDQPRGVAAATCAGWGTHWIDHALMPCEDPGLNERFLAEVLDFKTAERVVTSMEEPEVIGTWMSCGESPHDIAFIKGPNGKLHHFAYHLEDWSSILRAGDIFSMDDVPIDIGPTRHGITRVRRSTSSIRRVTATRCSRGWVIGCSTISRRSTGRSTSWRRGSSTTPVS